MCMAVLAHCGISKSFLFGTQAGLRWITKRRERDWPREESSREGTSWKERERKCRYNSNDKINREKTYGKHIAINSMRMFLPLFLYITSSLENSKNERKHKIFFGPSFFTNSCSHHLHRRCPRAHHRHRLLPLQVLLPPLCAVHDGAEEFARILMKEIERKSGKLRPI